MVDPAYQHRRKAWVDPRLGILAGRKQQPARDYLENPETEGWWAIASWSPLKSWK